MKRKVFLRSLLGFPLGIAIGYLITIFISLCYPSGEYLPCPPQLVTAMGSELNAVLLQAALCGVLGAGFAAASAIWEMEDWGLMKQTGIYFAVISLLMLPIAYISYWMEHSLRGVLGYFGIFVMIFLVIWLVQYAIARHNVKKMNDTLKKR